MKRIGIILAMEEELQALLNNLRLIKKTKIFDLLFYTCIYQDTECILVEAGIGKVNAARCTQIMIDKMNVDCIFNIGVAGSISNKVDICDIVVGDKLVQHDFDFTPFNLKKGEIPNVGQYINSDAKLLNVASKIRIDTKMHIGTIASGDIFISENQMSNKIANKFGALCVEMEGAAIAQVCYLSKIPFLVIRAISDSPNKDNNKITYDDFLKISSKMVAKFMIQILEIFNQDY